MSDVRSQLLKGQDSNCVKNDTWDEFWVLVVDSVKGCLKDFDCPLII